MKLLLCLLFIAVSQGAERELLRDVRYLNFYKGLSTQYKRSGPIPQQTCEGGFCGQAPYQIHCLNIGQSNDVVWECTGINMNSDYKIDNTVISCEGYDYPDDPYVVRGSCGITFHVNAVPDKQLLSSIDHLVFNERDYAVSRKYPAVKQMNCLGNNCLFGPTDIFCRNIRGAKTLWNTDPLWDCHGYDVDTGYWTDHDYVIANTVITCEGYDYSDDPYILRNSCSIEYNVVDKRKKHNFMIVFFGMLLFATPYMMWRLL